MTTLNLQQMPKSPEFLECFVARPGHKLVSMDFNSVEPRVLTWASQDKNLMKLYGPDAVKNDVYLFNACQMGNLGNPIRQCGYDPDNPTPESISLAKHECKRLRSISKILTLSGQYNAGPYKWQMILADAGIEVTLHECKAWHQDYWTAYGGIKTFERKLKHEYFNNGGWIFNGFQRPLSISFDKVKDIINRFVQSTAHDMLLGFIVLLKQELDNREVRWKPWIIDFHDETMIDVPEKQAERAADCFRIAQERLGEVLTQAGWNIDFPGDVIIADNLAQIKCED